MSTERQPTRRLEWEGCLNARDLGGYPTADGRETRWGAVVRSDSLAPLTAAGQAALVDHGVRSIVDLRMPSELAEQPNPFAKPSAHGVSYTNVSFIDPASAPPTGDFTDLATEYVKMLELHRASVAAVMTTIAEAPPGGVLIHCMGGKDRTGLIAALLLELAAVPRETIGADYALTAECLRPREEDFLENGPGERAERAALLAKYEPRAEVMEEVLGQLDERYGGVEGYLVGAGVTREQLAHLRDQLLPPTP